MFPLTISYIGTQEILILVFGVFGVLGTAFWVWQLVDVARRQFAEPNLKIVWVLVLVFTHLVGALIYSLVGRKQGRIPGE